MTEKMHIACAVDGAGKPITLRPELETAIIEAVRKHLNDMPEPPNESSDPQ